MKLRFNFLKKKKFLIFDKMNSQFFLNYLNKNDTEILHCRREEFNFWILLKCLFYFKLNYKNYILFYIKKVEPRAVFTLIDNSIMFYELKRELNCQTYSVQNGLRTEYEDFFSKENIKPKNLSCDKIFVWNNKVGQEYNKFINCKYVSIGSFKNNIYFKNELNKKNEIIYISTYKNLILNKKVYKNLTWNEFIKNEKALIDHIKNFCLINNFSLTVLGRYDEKSGEKDYFIKNFGKDFNFKYIPNSKDRQTYAIPKKFKLAITIDSTLGYEMLAAGCKVALIGVRPDIYPFNTRNYLWPNYQKSKGFYWINGENIQYEELSSLFTNLLKKNKEEWDREIKIIREEVINYDPGNNVFLNETNLI